MANRTHHVIAGLAMSWLLAGNGGAAAPYAYATGYDLYLDCSGQHGSFGEGNCVGFIYGILSIVGWGEEMCVPVGLDRAVTNIYIAWALRHPEKTHLPNGVAVRMAFAEEYPCSPWKGSKGR